MDEVSGTYRVASPAQEEPREPIRGANVVRLPPTGHDSARVISLVRGSPFVSVRLGQTYGPCLGVKLGAVAFIVFIDPQYAIDLQLIGGVIILQTLPAVAIALHTRWFHRWGLLAGWAIGLAWGLSMLYDIPNPTTGAAHFGGVTLNLGTLSILGWEPFAGSSVQIYAGLVALGGNLMVAALVTLVLRQLRVFNGTDQTAPQDFHADAPT